MKNNPCRMCRMRDEDKNNRLCLGCEKGSFMFSNWSKNLISLNRILTPVYMPGSAIPWRPHFPAG